MDSPAYPIVLVSQSPRPLPPARAELREQHPNRPDIVKVVYQASRTAAWIDRSRIIEESSVESQATATAVQEPSLVFADPATLVIGANVRVDPRLDKEFIASVRERGVLEPIVAYRDADDHLVVLRGKRRTLTAVEVGLKAVPVMVVPCPPDSDRLVDQVSENEHRAALTTAERAAAYEQMAAFGLSAAAIAKKTARPRAEVSAGLKVAGSEVAKSATEKHASLDLRQAAVVAEFEGDKKAVDQLLDAAKRGGFDHQAQWLRDQRAAAAAEAAATDELRAAGVKVVKVPGYDSTVKRLSQLTDDTGAELKADAHAQCPGHAAFVEQRWGSRGKPTWGPGYVCTDPQKHGHKLLYGSFGDKKPAAEKTEAEREAARAERRDVIESNKAWVSAETVRREWLKTLLARKSAPKEAATFIASSLASCDFAIRQALEGGHKLAHELLGAGEPGGYDDRGKAIDALLEKATEGRAQMLALALILAAYEGATSKDSWRRADRGTARYLEFIAGQGYELSDVERRACGEKSKAAAADA